MKAALSQGEAKQMVAILTKYIGPTNFKGSRVKAFTAQGKYSSSLTLSWDDALSVEANHIAAAEALASRLEWSGKYVGGSADRGMVFVNVGRACSAAFTVKKSKEEGR
jgi:hypothetical protein